MATGNLNDINNIVAPADCHIQAVLACLEDKQAYSVVHLESVFGTVIEVNILQSQVYVKKTDTYSTDPYVTVSLFLFMYLYVYSIEYYGMSSKFSQKRKFLSSFIHPDFFFSCASVMTFGHETRTNEV